MKLAHALVALLAVGGTAWWAAGHPGYVPLACEASLKRLGVGLALVVVVVAIAVAATRRAFVSAASETVPSPVVSSFFDALVDSIRFAFRLVFVLGAEGGGRE